MWEKCNFSYPPLMNILIVVTISGLFRVLSGLLHDHLSPGAVSGAASTPPQFSRVSGGWGGARGRIPRTPCTTRMASLATIFLCVPVLIFGNFQFVAANPDAKRLYDDLLSNYNKLVRPVVNTSDVLRVCIKLKLSQLIDVVSQLT